VTFLVTSDEPARHRHSGRETVVPRDLIGAYLLLVLLQQSDRVQVLQGAPTVVRGLQPAPDVGY
jgi:hypothetical protein